MRAQPLYVLNKSQLNDEPRQAIYIYLLFLTAIHIG